jgi:hypothetical protein
MDKLRYEAFTTPVGEAIFPWITKADTEYDPNGKFKTDLAIPFEEAQDFIAKLEAVRDNFIATLPINKQKTLTPRPVYTEEYTRPDYPEGATKEEKKALRDEWEGEPTGNVVFRFSLKAHVDTKDGGFDQAPVVVSAATGEAIEDPVYGGSMVRLRGQVVPYTNDAAAMVGVTLRFKACQVIELQTGSGSNSFWTDFDDA